MKTIAILMLTLAAPAVWAQSGKATPKAKAAAKPAAAENGPPKGSVQVEEDAWRYTDKAGKVFLYRKSLFGWMKSELTEADLKPASTVVSIPSDITVEDKGAELEFTRPTPFGPSRWTKKKTELDDVERAIWERSQAAK